MSSPIEHRLAAQVAEEALRSVFDPQAVSALRDDSPLTAIGLTSADVVCLADAVAKASDDRGFTCVLGDADLEDVHTVADLVLAIIEAAAPTEEDNA